MSDRFAKITSIVAAVFLLAGLIWGYGLGVGRKMFWPGEHVTPLIRAVKSFAKYGEFVPEGRRSIAPAGAARERMVVHDARAAIGSGYYAVTGYDNTQGYYRTWLHDAAGRLLHSWQIDDKRVDDTGEYDENNPHAVAVMKDGSVIVGFDNIPAMVRLDACNEQLWVKRGYYHHSFSPSEDGNIWTWFSPNTPYGQTQHIVKFDPETGDTVQRIDFVTDIVTKSPEQALIFSLRADTEFEADDADPADIFHPNDVEELSTALAPAFPMFAAGDLLLSLRTPNIVMVVDQQGNIKWQRQGPWLAQHDPDFQPDGTITVYNNRVGRSHSDIYIVDPKTDVVRARFPDWAQPFRSYARGKHQRLPNGNELLVIPEQGQVLEVAPDNKVVMEYNNIVAEGSEFNEDVANAAWLPADHFTKVPACTRG